MFAGPRKGVVDPLLMALTLHLSISLALDEGSDWHRMRGQTNKANSLAQKPILHNHYKSTDNFKHRNIYGC